MGAVTDEGRLTVAESVWMARRGPAQRVLVWRLLVEWDDKGQGFNLFSHYGASPGARPLAHARGRQKKRLAHVDEAALRDGIRDAFQAIEGKGYTPRRSSSAQDAFGALVDADTVHGWAEAGRAFFGAPSLPHPRRSRSLGDVIAAGRRGIDLVGA